MSTGELPGRGITVVLTTTYFQLASWGWTALDHHEAIAPLGRGLALQGESRLALL